jgi:hypothetical protein
VNMLGRALQLGKYSEVVSGIGCLRVINLE